MPLTLLDFVQQVENVTVQDIPDSTQDSINDELSQQTGGGGGTDISNPSDVRVVANTVTDLNGRAGFTSIQDAIDGANPENGAAGSPVDKDGTIFVEPGTYDKKPPIDTQGVTLKGPNAGIAGDSNERGGEASFEVGGPITADNVTIDGFELTTGNGFSEIQGEGTVIRNTTADVNNSAVVRLQAGSDGTVITQNAFTGDGGNFLINARQGARDGASPIDGVEITDNSFEGVTGEGKTAIQAAGFTNAEISGNSFDEISEDAVRLAGDVSGTELTDNEFSNYAQDSSISGGDIDAGAVIAVEVSGDVDISGNQFNDAGGDNVYINTILRNDPAALDLSTIVNKNTFQPDVVVGDAVIREAPAGGTVLNIDKGESSSDIQPAIDAADSGDTIAVGSGIFDETVNIGVDNLTLEGAEGAEGAEPVINGNGAENAVVAGADDVTVRGFQVEGFKERGIYDTEIRKNPVEVNDGMLIEDNVVTEPDPGDATVQAIQIEGDDAQVIDNTIEGIPEFEGPDFDSSGILAESTDNAEIRNNTVEVSDLGIATSTFFGDATGNTIEGNDVTSTDGTGIQVGTNALESPGENSASDTDIIDNTVEDSATGLGIRDFGGAGISETDVSDNDFVNNEVHVNDPDDFVDLDAILNNQGNTFNPAGEVNESDQIVPEGQQQTS